MCIRDSSEALCLSLGEVSKFVDSGDDPIGHVAGFIRLPCLEPTHIKQRSRPFRRIVRTGVIPPGLKVSEIGHTSLSAISTKKLNRSCKSHYHEGVTRDP